MTTEINTLESLDDKIDDKIAIIGMACRLPGAKNVFEFWDNLKNAKNSIITFTDEELQSSGVSIETLNNPNYVKKRGVPGDSSGFDAGFFGFTPREAEILDPQHRVFLECCLHAMEDAGYNSFKTDLRIGVFGGAGTTWNLVDIQKNPELLKLASGTSIVIANDKDYLTSRTSYKLNLTGPSVNVQSACSTSLVAVNLGMNSLLNYQTDMILAGGATITVPEKVGYLYQEGGMESADGTCRPFDAEANGTVFSRGCGVVLLKRLSDAIKDKDNIYAVIIGGAINNDGSDKVGFSAPGVNGQIEVETEAIEMADISPETISFVEAHGTATSLGDPIEVSALTKTFFHYTDKKMFCPIGSVKSNIGHTDIASGAASLIKAVLSLKYKKLPASINYEKPNPKIDFENSPFFVNTGLLNLENNNNAPLRGLVNSFGVGGTNACVILEEGSSYIPEKENKNSKHDYKIFPFSAKSENALTNMIKNFSKKLEGDDSLNLDNAAYTLQVGRSNHKIRTYFSAIDKNSLIEKLNKSIENEISSVICEKEDRPVVFMFPGQGNQYVNMGLGLYKNETVFKDAVDECSQILEPIMGLDLLKILYPSNDDIETAKDLIDQTHITQPVLFVNAYATAKLWKSWGINPDIMVGHSVGEYVAACLSGVFSLEDALYLIAKRGKMIFDLPKGSMLAVLLPEEKLLAMVKDFNIEISVINSPGLCVVSGTTEDIIKFKEFLQLKKIFVKDIPTSHAFHSKMMEPMLEGFLNCFKDITFSSLKIPFVSAVTGEEITNEEAKNPSFWVNHVRKPVRFSDSISYLLNKDDYIFLEVGVGRSLSSAVKNQVDKSKNVPMISSILPLSANPHALNIDLNRDLEFISNSIGKLFTYGKVISWEKYYQDEKYFRMSLPGYPFEHRSYAVDIVETKEDAKLNEKKDGRKKKDVGKWFYIPTWKRSELANFLEDQNKTTTSNEKTKDDFWVIFVDEKVKLVKYIKDQLVFDKKEVITVKMGDNFSFNEDVFTINPNIKDHYNLLFEELKNRKAKNLRLIHLFNVSPINTNSLSIENIDSFVNISYYSPLYMEQAIIKHNLLDDLKFIIVTSGVYDVVGEDILSPEKALVTGPCRVMNREHRLVRCRAVDIEGSWQLEDESSKEENEVKALSKNLINETLFDTLDSVVSYRGGYRWVEDYNNVYFNKTDDFTKILKENKTYLITGGLGGLGLLTAKSLFDMVSSNLILTYRSPIPERDDWQNWLKNHPEDDSTSEKIESILALEEKGANVMLAQVDIADFNAMEKLVIDATKKFGEINGVIHTAGIVGGGVLSLIEKEKSDKVFESKVKGTLILDEIFKNTDLDFFIVYSSITSVLGEAGRIDYCSANAFMDAFIHYRAQNRSGISLSLNWGQWGVIGMGAHWEESKVQKQSMLEVDQSFDAYDESFYNRLKLIDKNDKEEVYEVLLDPSNDWVINSHLISGIPTLVGTTFFELLHSFKNIEAKEKFIEIGNVYFLAPLMFPKKEKKKIQLVINRLENKFKFCFKSRVNDSFFDHIIGEFNLIEEDNPIKFDISSLKEEINLKVDENPVNRRIPVDAKVPIIDLGLRWDNLDLTYIGENSCLGQIELKNEFTNDFRNFYLHPAIVDICTSFAIKHFANATFLPFTYKQINIYGKLSGKLFSYAKLCDNYNEDNETIAFDISILDEGGKELISIKHYTLKKVTSKTTLIHEKKGAGDRYQGAEKPQLKQAIDYSQSRDILPDEGADAFKRIITTPGISQVVISTSDLRAKIEETIPLKIKMEDEVGLDERVSQKTYPRPSLSTSYVEPTNEVETEVAKVWQQILGIDKIGIKDNFMELGGNSLLAIQVIANIADTFEINLPVENFINNPTVEGISKAVVDQLLAMASDEDLDELIDEVE